MFLTTSINEQSVQTNKGYSLYYPAIILIASVAPTILFNLYPYIRTGAAVGLAISLFFALYFSFQVRKPTVLQLHIRYNFLDIAVSGFFIYILARYITSPPYFIQLDKLFIYTTGFCSYFFIRKSLANDTAQSGSTTLYVILFFGLTQSTYALLQKFGLLPNIFDFPMGGTYGNPGDLANVLLISYSISLGFVVYETDRFKLVLLSISTGILLVSIILSVARTAWIAVAIITVYLFIHRFNKHLMRIASQIPKVIKYLGIVGMIGGIIFISIRLYTMKKGSADGRIFIWEHCIELIKERPFFGHGYDSFTSVYSLHQTAYFMNHPHDSKNGLLVDDIFYAYNEFLHWGVEYGVPGVLFLVAIIALALKSIKKAPDDSTPDRHLVKSALIGIVVTMFFSYPFQNATILITFFILLAIASAQKHNKPFTIQIPTIFSQIAIYTGTLVCALAVLALSYYLAAALAWKRTYENLSDKPALIEKYDYLLKVLKYDNTFLYHYGAILFKKEKYMQCAQYFEKYRMNTVRTDVYIMLGDSYKELCQYEKAIGFYQNAINTKPSLFVPKHKLFLLYKDINQKHKAREMAQIIMETKVKVISQVVKQIKNDAQHYLLYE